MNLVYCRGGGFVYTYIGAIVAYLLTEKDLGTGSSHFESIDCPLLRQHVCF
jgi:hypothetical protein